MPFLTIATVTLNDPNGFERTASSIIPLLNPDIIWIIKDGGSCSSVLEYMKSFLPPVNVHLVSSPDLGIYDAMNFCLTNSLSNWLVFMNGGDTFDSNNFPLLISFLRSLRQNEKSIVSGATNVIDKYGTSRLSLPRQISSCVGCNSYRMTSFHQSQVFSKQLYKTVRFNLDLKISSDHAFFWQCVTSGAPVILFNRTISSFYYDGLSSRKPLQSAFDNWYTFRNIQSLNLIDSVFAFAKKISVEFVFVLSRLDFAPIRHCVYKLFFCHD